MKSIIKVSSFYCGGILWISNAIICFTSPVTIFKPINNTISGVGSIIASVLFFIYGYKEKNSKK